MHSTLLVSNLMLEVIMLMHVLLLHQNSIMSSFLQISLGQWLNYRPGKPLSRMIYYCLKMRFVFLDLLMWLTFGNMF